MVILDLLRHPSTFFLIGTLLSSVPNLEGVPTTRQALCLGCLCVIVKV